MSAVCNIWGFWQDCIMWWDSQNLDKPRRDKSGKRWNFRVWHEVWTEDKVLDAQRVFFWDDEKDCCGVVLLLPGTTLHVRDLHRLIEKLVADPELREEHKRDLRFPIERHYSEYGAFSEEANWR
jgi:hypothetical protein